MLSMKFEFSKPCLSFAFAYLRSSGRIMGSGKRVRSSALLLCFFLVDFLILSSFASSEERSLVVGECNKTLQISPSLPVENSPGLKPGTKVLCERVHIDGLSRLRNLKKFAHSVKVKILQSDAGIRKPNVEVCFHRNASLLIGMCPQGQWEKVSKGLWVRTMSPFDHKHLDIRVTSHSLETLEVFIEEEFFLFRIICLIFGVVLLTFASSLSQSLVFYYGSAMTVGVILVVLVVLFQGMKLLPTGRKSSLAIFLYSSMVGLGTFFLQYLSGFLQSILSEMGISEDMYNPLVIFLLAFIGLAGAWLGFWVVRKFVLTEDGSIDISIARFVVWSIRILAMIMILQSSLDHIVAAVALLSGLILSSLLRKVTRLRSLRRTCKKFFRLVKGIGGNTEIPDLSPSQDSYDEYVYKSPEDNNFFKQRSKRYPLTSCNTYIQGITKSSPSQLSDSYPSTIHNTPERRKFSKDEWEKFTRESTKKAIDELVSSPDFSKWVSTNADRITVTPRRSSAGSSSTRRRGWFQRS